MQTSLIFSQEVSPASPTPQQESEKVRRTLDTSGRKCLEQSEKLSQFGWWEKTFMACLVGQKGWFSMRSSLSWKLRFITLNRVDPSSGKVTKFSRFYFQLVASMLPIRDTGSGLLPTAQTQGLKVCNEQGKTEFINLGLLPTPTTGVDRNTDYQQGGNCLENVLMDQGLLPTPQAIDGNGEGRELRLKKDCNRDPNQPGSWRGDLKDYAATGLLPTPKTTDSNQNHGGVEMGKNGGFYREGTNVGANLSEVAMKLLPTPTAMDATAATAAMKSTQVKEGSMHSMTLSRCLAEDMLPTPRANDIYHSTKIDQPSFQHTLKRDYMAEVVINSTKPATGKNSQLNPRFVAEMMGFPVDWTELPFLNGEQSQSKDMETQ